MNRYEKRLSDLEARTNPVPPIVVLKLADGETHVACVIRHGYNPAQRGTAFITLDDADSRA